MINKFLKISLIFLAIVCIVITIKSGDLLEEKDLHKSSFIHLSLTKYINQNCEEVSELEDTSSTSEDCIPIRFPVFESTASGLLIRKINGISYAITANHFCNSESDNPSQSDLFETSIILSDFKSLRSKAEIVYFDKQLDLCLLSSNIERRVETIKFSSMPKIGEKIYAIASPLGISESGILLHFDGFFSGCDGGVCFYTIPATSGSSGSIVFDMDGDAIGIIQMTPVYFRSMSIGVGSDDIVDFLNRASDYLGVDLI